MNFKKENIYLFLALILIISTNIYLSCKLIPKQEGFRVMKKVKRFFEKQIKNTLIKKPIQAIPLKPLRRFFLSRINFKKSLIKVILQLLFAIVQAAIVIMVLVPVLTIALMPLVMFLVTSVGSLVMLLFKTLFKAPTPIPKIMNNIPQVNPMKL